MTISKQPRDRVHGNRARLYGGIRDQGYLNGTGTTPNGDSFKQLWLLWRLRTHLDVLLASS
jgi:hypothetical protein